MSELPTDWGADETEAGKTLLAGFEIDTSTATAEAHESSRPARSGSVVDPVLESGDLERSAGHVGRVLDAQVAVVLVQPLGGAGEHADANSSRGTSLSSRPR